MLQAGDTAPPFKLTAGGGQVVDSESLAGREYLLYFYPKDSTPGCTREACAFRDNLPALEKLGLAVFGVSADTRLAHERFAQKHALNFPLLADSDHQLLEAYGVWVEKSLYGRKFMGILRSSFLVGADGRIEKAWPKVNPDRHAEEVLTWLRERASARR